MRVLDRLYYYGIIELRLRIRIFLVNIKQINNIASYMSKQKSIEDYRNAVKLLKLKVIKLHKRSMWTAKRSWGNKAFLGYQKRQESSLNYESECDANIRSKLQTTRVNIWDAFRSAGESKIILSKSKLEHENNNLISG
jgi:hypothetical protein